MYCDMTPEGRNSGATRRRSMLGNGQENMFGMQRIRKQQGIVKDDVFCFVCAIERVENRQWEIVEKR
jgi:hypothetical protein